MASLVKEEPVSVDTVKVEEAVEEINIFVTEDNAEENGVEVIKDDKQQNDLEVPVVTIRVPMDSEDTASCNIELKYVPKSLVQAPKVSGRTLKPVHTYKPAPKAASLKPVQKILPKTQPTGKTPVWRRETPKVPGSVSNYMYPHDLKVGRSRLIIDCPTNIPVAEFKSQLADTSDIVTTLDVAPSSKKKVKELNTNSVSKLFAYPGKMHPSPRLRGLYQRHLTSKFTDHQPTEDLALPPLDGTHAPKPGGKRAAPVLAVQPTPKKVAPAPTGQVVQLLIKQADGEESQEIILLHDGADGLAPDTLQNIQMVLASAEEEGKCPDGEQVFYCNSGETEYIIVQNSEVTVQSEAD